jgi:hypothetical protein
LTGLQQISNFGFISTGRVERQSEHDGHENQLSASTLPLQVDFESEEVRESLKFRVRPRDLSISPEEGGSAKLCLRILLLAPAWERNKWSSFSFLPANQIA